MTHPALVNPFMGGPVVGDPCCRDCGICPPCDAYCPHVRQLMQQLRELTQTFEIEPVPAFLTRARQSG